MNWNCPHCATIVSLGIDIDQVKRAYVRCGVCRGVALITKKEPQANPESRSSQEAFLQDMTAEMPAPPKRMQTKAKEKPQQIPLSSLTIEDALDEFNLDLAPPPFSPSTLAGKPRMVETQKKSIGTTDSQEMPRATPPAAQSAVQSPMQSPAKPQIQSAKPAERASLPQEPLPPALSKSAKVIAEGSADRAAEKASRATTPVVPPKFIPEERDSHSNPDLRFNPASLSRDGPLDLSLDPSVGMGFQAVSASAALPKLQAQGAVKKKEPPSTLPSEAPEQPKLAAVPALPQQNPVSTDVPPTPPASSAPSTPAQKTSASAVHQFEFRESLARVPASENSRIYQFPKPPEFLTRQEDLLQSAFQTVHQQLPEKKDQKPLSIAVAVAAVIAILSGIYLFMQGHKFLQEGRRNEKTAVRFSQQDIPSTSLAARAAGVPSSVKDADAPMRPLTVVVRAQRAVLRSAPDAASAVVTPVKANDVLVVKAQKSGWFKVASRNGDAWILSDLVDAQ